MVTTPQQLRILGWPCPPCGKRLFLPGQRDGSNCPSTTSPNLPPLPVAQQDTALIGERAVVLILGQLNIFTEQLASLTQSQSHFLTGRAGQAFSPKTDQPNGKIRAFSDRSIIVPRLCLLSLLRKSENAVWKLLSRQGTRFEVQKDHVDTYCLLPSGPSYHRLTNVLGKTIFGFPKSIVNFVEQRPEIVPETEIVLERMKIYLCGDALNNA